MPCIALISIGRSMLIGIASFEGAALITSLAYARILAKQERGWHEEGGVDPGSVLHKRDGMCRMNPVCELTITASL